MTNQAEALLICLQANAPHRCDARTQAWLDELLSLGLMKQGPTTIRDYCYTISYCMTPRGKAWPKRPACLKIPGQGDTWWLKIRNEDGSMTEVDTGCNPMFTLFIEDALTKLCEQYNCRLMTEDV